MKTLVLFTATNRYFFDRIENPDIDVCSVFEDDTGSTSPICKFLRKINSPLTKMYYMDWYRKSYEKIIVMELMIRYDSNLLYNINKKFPNAKKYVYSWNIIRNEEAYYEQRKLADENDFSFYSYDEGNCEKYDLKFNTIMYDINLKLQEVQKKYDAFFLGFLKDRGEKIIQLYTIMKKAGLNPRFTIVKCKNKGNLLFEFSDDYIDYYKYLGMLNESKAILDIAQENQQGYSMRVMEAIFFDKKLITTNKNIKNADFYNDKNILLIDLNDIDESAVKEFYEKEMQPYSEEIKSYYSFEEWVDRFN